MAVLLYLWLLIVQFYFYVPQNSFPEETYVLHEDGIPTFVEKMPEFPGGEMALMRFMTKEMVLQKRGKEEAIQTSFYIEFIIDSDGKVVMLKINKKQPEDMTTAEKSVLQMVRKMPRWKPGEQAGKKVPVKMHYPLILEIRE